MKQIKVSPDKIVIKGHYSYLVSGVILLSAGSFPLIDFVLPMIFDVDLFTPDGMPVLCLVAILLFFFGVSLFMLLRFFETVTVDENGILRTGLRKSKKLSWEETADCGVFYDVTSRYPMYVVYFSAENLETNKKETRKKLRGRTIKIYVAQSQFGAVTESLLPFCRRFSSCEPFLNDTDYLKKFR